MTIPQTKQKKVVRFTDGVKEGEKQVDQQTDTGETTHKTSCQEETTHVETKECSQSETESEKPSSPFLEQLLEVDQIENGHTAPTGNKGDNPAERGKTFITCRNYLSEQGIEQTAHSSHEQKIFTIQGPIPQKLTRVTTKNVFQPFNVASNEHNRTLVPYSPPIVPQVNKGYSHSSLQRSHNMSYFVGGEMSMLPGNVSRLSEKEELQRLNDRLTSYVNRVRIVSDQGNQIDSSAFLKSAKILEEEMNNLKNIYEQELDKLRKDIEMTSREKNTLQIQSNKHQQAAAEIQDRLSVESDKSRKLVEETTLLQRQVTGLEAQLHSAKMAATMKGPNNSELLQRNVEGLTRENETLKHRYEVEQVARQEAEDRVQQLMKKLEFNDQVNAQHVLELRNRVETSTGTILSLEAKVRELSKNDTSMGDLLKSVREASEAEFKKYQMESDVEYNRNIAALRVQLDNDAGTIERLQTEMTQLEGSAGEMKARVRSLEGQLSNMEHQRKSLEDMLGIERSRSAENIRTLEKKLREVQEVLFTKIKEATSIREANVPLKAEIESLKLLLEEEEKRLRVQVNVGTTQPTSVPVTFERPLPPTAYPYSTSPPAMGNFNTSLAASSSYIPIMPPTYPGDPISSTALPDYTIPLGTTSPYEPDFTTTHIPNYLDPTEPTIEFPMATSKYMYETSPSVNRLQVEPSPPETPRGPVTSHKYQRAKSAPVSGPRSHNLPLVPTSLGQGKDYFDEMFQDLQRDTLYSSLRPKSSPLERPPSSTYHDYTVATSSPNHTIVVSQYTYSAIGDVKIMEVQQDGKYVRLLNDGAQELEFGGFMLQQNVGGHPVAVYRFPPRTKFPSNSTITVWSGMNDPILHQPPSDFVWKEQQKWGTGPECTSILCRPNGQAIAWTTAAHRFTRNAFEDGKDEEQVQALDLVKDDDLDLTPREDESLTEINVDVGNKQDHVYLRREKQPPPSLSAQRHPHGSSSAQACHPHNGQSRPLMYGNDNSTWSRQSRQQSTRPDPIPGQPYAGAAAQRMGSAPLRKYLAQSATVKGSGTVANRSAGTIRFGPPTPFLSPLQQEFSASKDNRPSSSLVRFTA
ncbi:lamin-B2-like isoform X3 [Haliotis rufescens]|uniref:lamin-B2-like isoform X3 n=1 Tax=Haliotis rufescens TaxID=6454 RepID=UPI00201F0DBD|nr:lamin-B2-like isoform X3 [Haliotis rufescens]